MGKRHDWHEFDADAGLEARRTRLGWQVRTPDGRKKRLTKRQFDRLRTVGPNPRGL